jgi:phage terminase small subunit
MLTAKQEVFVQNLVTGMSQADAYRSAYNTKKMSDNAIYREASLLMDNPKVSQRYRELVDQTAKVSIMTAQERLEWLTGLIKDPEMDINAKLKASDQMNRMQGEYVTKVEGNLNVTKLEDLL